MVPDLVGWPADQRDSLLPWGAATFDILGPMNRHAIRSLPASLRMLHFARRVVRERSLIDGSMGHEVLRAADDGKVTREECAALMIDYIAPSLDTTISAISNALHLFATHPDQWQALKDDPARIPNAINEIVRYESPLRAFSRQALSTPLTSPDTRFRQVHACLSSTPQRIATNSSGRILSRSTSDATPPANSGSAMAPTPALDKGWHALRLQRCCVRSSTASTGSS